MSDDLIHPKDFYGKLNTAIREAGGVSAFARLHNLDTRRVYETQDAVRYHEDVARAVGLVPVARYPVAADPKSLVGGKVVYEKLNTFVRECGSQKNAADKFGISKAHLGNIINARRGLRPVLASLGFMAPLTRFVPVK
ncbi:hypothetical protein AA23498_3589 [Acetobacter nitrogenifigens DSM 23921 = NBRC 105050]|uniref:Uncharacterized protein n=1 Tax=Acetobacter nitrogenifigens DSM 23921 = NBRC 105050 TaxID=1120919 RepID=A0A511XE04_9PROT|nr:hypothetical protein [Acetobacter nitrogenifigens]GBQ99901.1 hypothetical protein AA23498_3589 [Acetobacter nitrogenifigens DSM 23921 = NBRC 105050]GEN61182.1 hypothetical protein ANI02nite_30660 [Acetobacter nitrogenifigens DSM 23921 = NBRC 105050]